MAVNIDIAIVDNDAYITGGDFAIEVSDNQHIIDNIASFKGWCKEFPNDGVGVFKFENSSGQEQLIESLIKQQLQSDGYQCDRPGVSFSQAGKLIINPNATKV